jgi:ectoine hydroxylase-related dioxygenase (phytanoyl-CoA dioxygenase family)
MENSQSPPLVTEEELKAYLMDGVVCLRGIVTPEEVESLKTAIDDDIKEPGPFYHGYGKTFHGNLRTWETNESFKKFCCDSKLPVAAQRLFNGGSKVNLLYDQIFVKEPQAADQKTRYHNDQPYWPVRGWQILSAWVALDHTDTESGGLQFIRGSHKWGRFFQPESFGDPNAEGYVNEYEINPNYEKTPDFENAKRKYDLISFQMHPGDVLLFHGLTVHFAGGNHTDRRRRGYTVRYCGSDVRYSMHIGTNVSLRNEGKKDGDELTCEQYPLILK